MAFQVEKHKYGDSVGWIYAARGLCILDEHVIVASDGGHDFWERSSFALRSPGSQTLSPQQWHESCKGCDFLLQTWEWSCGAPAHRVKELATSCDLASENDYIFYGLRSMLIRPSMSSWHCDPKTQYQNR